MASPPRAARASMPPSPSSPRPYAPSTPGPSHPRPVPSSSRPVPVRPPPPPPPPPTQPTTVKLSPSGLRNFAFRLTHPPEIPSDLVSPIPPSSQTPSARAKGKARAHWWSWDLATWGIQPHYKVSLEDVLARKHLPPLGLKDFEEWLLFVDGAPENLYFILWLRAYTTRYGRWTSSLKSSAETKRAKRKQRHSQDLTFNTHPPPPAPLQPPMLHHPNPLQPGSSHHMPSGRERPFPSLGLAISFLSTSSALQPALGHSQPSSPTAVSSPTSPGAQDAGEGHEHLDGRGTDRRFRPYAPSPPPLPPNPSLALFYLRAKETFFAPGAPYDLNIGSNVLGAFFPTEDEKAGARSSRHDTGDPYDALRNLSSKDFQRISKGANSLGGKLPPPPDPQVFDEIKDIVEGRLKASLERLVVATYNNVGMSRAYCGNAGGMVIGIITSGPPLAASFSLHASRWWRIFALPGMWLGLTIFISALYGVCMMIYIFGDLRQLRSFELSRPAISNPKPLRSDPLSVHRESLKNITRNPSKPPSPTGVTFTNPFPTSGGPATFSITPSPTTSVLPDSKRSLPALDLGAPSEKAVPRKMSLPTGLFFGSRARAEQDETERERFERMLREATTPLTHPPVMPPPPRVRPASVSEAALDPLESSPCLPTLTIVPPERVHFDHGKRKSLDGAALEVTRACDNEEIEEEGVSDEGYTSDSSCGSSGSDSESDEDEDEDEDECVDPTQRTRRRRRRRRPAIEVSDAFYDEHPSPEGPATAPADWFPSSLERAARMNPIRDCPGPVPPHVSGFTSSNTSSYLASSRGSAATHGKKKPPPTPGRDPLWPDYDGNGESPSAWAQWMQRDADDGRRAERSDQQHEPLPGTAMFIRPYAYDASEPWVAGCGPDDLEKGLRHRAAGGPVGGDGFDFDGLPARTTFSVTLKPSAPHLKEDAKGKGATDRASSPAPSQGTRSDLGSAIDAERCGWLARQWWQALEFLQRHCSPDNVVQVLRQRRSRERAEASKEEEKAGARGDTRKGEREREKGKKKEEKGWDRETKEKEKEEKEKGGERDVEKAVEPAPQEPAARRNQPCPAPNRPLAPAGEPECEVNGWRRRLRRVYLSVPAFAAPLTPVLNPLVGRAQWEIVVRSATAALVISLAVVGGLLGVPE
ncbi:uncharacterized protein PHACADRAFT_265007 [Phanerochaete carnosa HHB-10118-sp]|uniref:RGS domain-containing protein n=1 Tax=Phanerochaete carnosa (strain HHB-10118-sp) TaxID=650164 RepID=K5VRV1_PHACS|nr:uncharacterized protein PHACADRAFT_265007 [Phanerochaete carnosa HHB-10118-sp]EKM49495.1 hypothetical protein PHACADRAFT_265007 [Phanerochaete carnosa HHB-10118-sp]